MENVLIYSDSIANSEYTPTHPFKPVRARFFLELLNRYHRNDYFSVLSPERLDEELLYLFHDEWYIDLLKRADRGEFTVEMLYAGLGTADNPLFRGMFDLMLKIAGGTYAGAKLLLNGKARCVFSPISGLHHAERNRASGFCYVNDIAIAGAALVREGRRIACVDIDAHHGNGVQDAFYASDRVLTISVHESGETLFPGSGNETEIGEGAGVGYNVNIPLKAGTDDEVYVYAFDAIVPQLLEQFAPEIVFMQIGGDCHRDDPLAHLNVTSNGYKSVVGTVNSLSPRILAMGGGGYNVFKTAALWVLAWSTLTGVKPEDKFAGLVGGMMYGPEMEAGSLEDLPFASEPQEKDACFSEAERVVEQLRKTVFPLHGL
jgi:acetoin utilization protein AcuC